MALEKYNFSSDFQDLLLAAMVRYPEKFIGVKACLNFKYFTGLDASSAAQLILDYADEHNTFPSFTVLGQMAFDQSKVGKSEDFSNNVTEYVSKLSETEVQAGDIDYLKKAAIKFAQERALLIEIRATVENIQAGKPHENLVGKFQTALSIGVDLSSMGSDAVEDADAVLDKILNPNYGVQTGYELLDNKFLTRGMGKGWLIVPLAPPKGYKTTFCLNIALNVAGPVVNEDVVYYACEINEELALERVYCSLTQKTHDQAMEDKDGFRAKVHEELGLSLCNGRLIVKHFPAKTVSISDIRAHLRVLCATRNIKPRLVVIDYAETIVPEDKNDQEHRQQSSIYTSARALADEFECTVLMPDRCNRETVEQATPTITSFQGAFEKGGIVDVGIGICATPEEQQRNILRFFVFLYRYGPAGLHFQGRIDPDKYTITIDRQLGHADLQRLNNEMAEVRQARHGRGNRGGGGGANRAAANRALAAEQ